MVFQHFNLFNNMNVLKNLTIAPMKINGKSKEEAEEKAMGFLKRMGLEDKVNAYPSQLSGGQKQRIAIVRSLMMEPEVMLFDEPTSALDPETTVATLGLLKRINLKLGVTIVLITHEMNVVKQICDRVAVMNKGEVVEEGSVIDIFSQPRHETTKALIGNVIAKDLPNTVISIVEEARRQRGRDEEVHLLRLSFVGSDVTRPVISECSREFGIDLNILRGTVDAMQGRTVGSLTVFVEAARPVYENAVRFMKERGVIVEELTDAQ